MPAETEQTRDPRVFLAIERTFLAWTRTALALIGFGFVVARLGLFLKELAGVGGAVNQPASAIPLTQSSQSLWLGTALVGLGVLVQVLALTEYFQHARRFKAGEPVIPLRWSLSPLLGFALIAIGVGMAVYLMRLF